MGHWGLWPEGELKCRAEHKRPVLWLAVGTSGSVPATCRCCGITRTCFYKWRRRYEQGRFEVLANRSSVPHHSPNATSVEVIEKILWLRQQYHLGPHKIAMYLKRYHDVTISPSWVWRILNKLGMSRLPASQHYKSTRPDGSVTRSSCPAISCRWT